MTTLALTTLCDGDCDLFPFWLEHYRSLGVDRFIVCWDTERAPDFKPSHSLDLWIHPYRGAAFTGEDRDEEERMSVRQACLLDNWKPDWILYTDLDEHQEYQGGLHAALAKADAAGDDFVMGVHVDRLAADGSLRELPARDGLLRDLTLDDVFPLRANLSRDVLGIRYTKVMAAKPHVFVRPGRHGTREFPFAAKRPGILADGHLVHHFKWRAGVLERIRDRMAKLPAEYNWYRNAYGPFLEMVEKNGGRIPLEAACGTTTTELSAPAGTTP